MSNVTLRKLKWIGILAPAVFIGSFELVRHQYFHSIDYLWSNLLGVGLVGAASYAFAHFVFRQVATLQRDSVRRSLELGALNNVIQAAGRSLDLNEVLKITTDKVLEVIPGTGGAVYLLQEKWLARSYQTGLPDACMAATLDLEETSFNQCEQTCLRTVKEGRVNTSACREAGQCVFAPIEFKDKVLGVFCLRQDKRFESWEVDFLSLVSRQVGFAVEHARLHSRVQELVVLEERDRIAKEIHDGLAQVLGYVSLKSGAVQQMLASNNVADARGELAEVERVAQEAYADAREAILGLRASVGMDGGVVRALNEYIVRVRRSSGLHIDLNVDRGQAFTLLPTTEVQLIRIVQEALTNVRKHARATKATVKFCFAEGAACVTVEDDGRGFDVAAVTGGDGPHFGLQAMKERAAKVGGVLRVESTPGKGTKVEVILPVKAVKAQEEKIEVP